MHTHSHTLTPHTLRERVDVVWLCYDGMTTVRVPEILRRMAAYFERAMLPLFVLGLKCVHGRTRFAHAAVEALPQATADRVLAMVAVAIELDAGGVVVPPYGMQELTAKTMGAYDEHKEALASHKARPFRMAVAALGVAVPAAIAVTIVPVPFIPWDLAPLLTIQVRLLSLRQDLL